MLDRLRLKRSSASTYVPLSSRLTGAIAVAVTLVVGLVAGGCGSSGKGTTSTATKPALSKAQFLAEGNAICRQGNQKLAATQRALEKTVGNHAPTQAQITAYVNAAFAPSIEGQIEQIRALGAPSGEQATVTNILDLAQTDLNRVKSKPTLLAANSDPFASFARLAHPYGLTACAAKSS
jgi:hypothetical protein